MKAGWGRGAAATRGSHSHRPPTAFSAGHLKQLDLERRTSPPRPRCGVDFAGCAARAGAVAGRAGSAGWGCSPPVPIPPGRRCCAPGASPAPRRGCRRGRREGCGSAGPALVCIADRARRFVPRAEATIADRETEGRRNEEGGTRDGGTGTEGRGTRDARHRAARVRRHGSVSNRVSCAMRTVRSCGLRLDADTGPLAPPPRFCSSKRVRSHN